MKALAMALAMSKLVIDLAVWADFLGSRPEKSAHTLDQSLHVTNYAGRVIPEPDPCEAHDTPPVDDEPDIAFAVRLEVIPHTMDLEAVELHRQLEIRPVSVEFSRAPFYPQLLVRHRCGKPGIGDELHKPLFQY